MAAGEMNILSDEALVAMAQEGSNTAYEFLIGKYRERAKLKARKYYISGADVEDVVQEGMIGIFKAIRDFDREAGKSFLAFLDLCIERQIQTAVSGANREKHRILNESLSLSGDGDRIDERVLAMGGGGFVSGFAAEADPGEIAVKSEAYSDLDRASNIVLSPFERGVWELMLKGCDYREIAARLGRPAKSVDNAIQRIKKKMRNTLRNY